ncbi:hypothetical protein J4471_04650 [Candidatus Woesearchaeota archaeon]|nr:hypothetical protein [Candidatus Woesearchaeota archaeon]
MPEKDIIVKKLSISYEGVFDFNNFIRLVKNWLKQNSYFIIEKDYGNIQKDKNMSDIKISLDNEREVDDYNRAHIDLSIKVKNLENVSSDKKKLQRGKLTIDFESYLKKDIHSKWETKPVQKVARGIYDKYLVKDKQKIIEEDIRNETFAVYNEVKAYFNLLNK